MLNSVSPVSTLLAALAAAVIFAPASAAGQTPDVGVLEISVDPAFPAAFALPVGHERQGRRRSRSDGTR